MSSRTIPGPKPAEPVGTCQNLSEPVRTSRNLTAPLGTDRNHFRRPALCVMSVACILFTVAAACAGKLPPRPAGSPVMDDTAALLFRETTSACAGLRTLTTEIGLSGRAGGERVRGRLHVGLAGPGALRIEAVAPFGAPVFILVSAQDRATLLFPRENQVLAAESVGAVLARLTGLDLTADELRLILSGCVMTDAADLQGRAWGDEWKAVSVGTDRTVYLRRQREIWQVTAAEYGRWRIDYSNYLNSRPRTVRIRAVDAAEAVDLTAHLEQLQVNVDLPPTAFLVDVPANAERLTLLDLRSVAVLRGAK